MSDHPFRPQIAKLNDELATLAAISAAPAPIVTRVVFSEADLRARAYVKGLCHEAGLTMREDAVGNTFARWEGSEPDLAPVATGSHIDAIPNAGAYDGTVGVLGGLEAIRILQRSGFQPRRSIELVIFTAEEPTLFGVGCLGSRMMSGALTPEQAATLIDKEGRGLDELRNSAGFSGDLASVLLPQGHFHGFVELHIEQGPLLEQEGISLNPGHPETLLGVVTHIAAPAAMRIEIEGVGGHAGALLMPDRRDALCGAAEIILAVERAARSTGAIDTVATVGVCDVFPSAINSVPSKVKIEIDVRDTDAARRDRVLAQIQSALEEVSARRHLVFVRTTLNEDPPASSAKSVITSIEAAATSAKLGFRPMISRAYHDALFVARFAPAAMIFIPCRGGISHRPDEYSSPEWIAAGVETLARTLADLSLQASHQ